MYTALDELAGAEEEDLLHPILTDVHARAYLSKSIPIRTHAIWTSLLAWNKDNIHLIASTKPDFFTWWKKFQLQASQHHLPPSVSWRLATWLLPDIYQDNILQYVKEPDFMWFNIDTWFQFVSRAAGGKDSALLAIDEHRALAPLPSESLSSFLLRFQSIAQRASSSTSLLETGLYIEDEFKMLHNTMKTHSSVFGTWIKNEWFSRYNKASTDLRSLSVSNLFMLQRKMAVRSSIRR